MGVGRKILLAIVLFLAIGTLHSIWYSATHAHFHLSVKDRSPASKTGRVITASGQLASETGEELSAFRIDDTGIFRVQHPQAGDCTEFESRASTDPQARALWDECQEKLARWVSDWASKVRRVRITVGNCTFDALPVRPSPYVNWWMWWAPIPHVGGVESTYYSASLELDSSGCSKAALESET